MSLRSSIEKPLLQDKVFSSADVLNALPAAIYLCDAAGHVIKFNDSAVRLWGHKPEIGKDLWCGSWKIFDLDGAPIPLDDCPMGQTLRTGKAVAGKEIIIEQPGGQRFNVQPHAKPLLDEGGTLVGAVNLLIDVTAESRCKVLEKQSSELTAAVESLKRSEERYHAMVAEVEDYAVILMSKEGTIQNWNRGAEEIKGYRAEEIIGKDFRIFYSEADRASGLPDRLLTEALSKGKANHEGWRVRKDGTRFWGSISITALHNHQGEVIGFTKVTRDLTERRNQELRIQQVNEALTLKNEQLRRGEERYHRMVTEVEDYVIILIDIEGRIENWNKGAEKIKGYKADEIIGKHFSIFYPEEDRQNNVPKKLLEEATIKGKAVYEGWRLRKDGTRFWGSVVITALHNDDGDVIAFTKVTRDLTDKKESEEKLMASSIALQQKNRELERINQELSSFAYISSHDLQEPLRKIQTFADRIVETEFENLTAKGKDYFRRIQAGAARMQKLIRDILAYSRTTTTEKIFEEKDLNDLLAQSKIELEVRISEKNAVIESDKLPTISVIPFQIQQLFNNLLNNALKFSKEEVRPHVRLTSKIVTGKNVPHPEAVPDKKYCHLRFFDNGIGFESEYNTKIFEVFQRLHPRSEYAGTGIGLAICKKIVENHNGFIFAEGKLGEGATFHIYLPVS